MATPRTTPNKPKAKSSASFSLEAAEKEYAESERPVPFTVDIGDGEGLVTLLDPQELSVSEIGNLRDETPLLALRSLSCPHRLAEMDVQMHDLRRRAGFRPSLLADGKVHHHPGLLHHESRHHPCSLRFASA